MERQETMLVFTVILISTVVLKVSGSSSGYQSMQNLSSFTNDLHNEHGTGEYDVISNESSLGRNAEFMKQEQASDGNYNFHIRRKPRDLNSVCELYRPIRIKAHFINSRFITNAQKSHLISVISLITDIVSRLFSVYPVKDRLLLKRTACNRVWESGINSGKCAYLGRSESTQCQSYPEFCSEAKEFQIPDKHLEGLYVWRNSNKTNPTVVCEEGQGLSDTDYILYVNADATHRCLQQDKSVIGYASHCQLGENDRPVAGYINICPLVLTDSHYKLESVVAAALHELLHALGFSVTLFNKMKNCQAVGSSIHCSDRRNPTQTNDQDLVTRFYTPAVVQAAANHFSSGKTRNMIGPALQTVNDVVTSHWDTAQMYGSIMAPSISLPELTFLDNITLAYFEDTGWYCVNYSLADVFMWGKDEGENFGVGGDCSRGGGKYFCHGSARGCHYMHTHKATCETNSFLRGCRIYRPKFEDSCLESPPDGVDVKPGEEFKQQSRCFLSNLTLVNDAPVGAERAISGRCYMHKCTELGELLVRVGSQGSFQLCPHPTSIQVEGFVGLVQCPPAGILCSSTKRTSLIQSLPTSPPPTSSTTPLVSSEEPMYLEMSFQSLPSSLLSNGYIRSSFIAATMDEIAARTKVSRGRLTDAAFTASDNRILFALQPSRSSADGPNVAQVFTVLQNGIASGEFSVHIRPGGPYFYAKQLRRINDREDEENQGNATSIIVIVCVTVSVLVLVSIVCLLVCRRWRRPSRNNDSRAEFSHSNNSRSV